MEAVTDDNGEVRGYVRVSRQVERVEYFDAQGKKLAERTRVDGVTLLRDPKCRVR